MSNLEQSIKQLAQEGTREALERYLPVLLKRLELPDGDKLYTRQGAADYMGTTSGVVKALVDRGELWEVPLGNAKHIPQRAISEYIESERLKAEFVRDQHRQVEVSDEVDPEIALLLAPSRRARVMQNKTSAQG